MVALDMGMQGLVLDGTTPIMDMCTDMEVDTTIVILDTLIETMPITTREEALIIELQ